MRLLAPLTLTALLAAAPAIAAADGPVVSTDRDCYLQTPKTTVSVVGTGFGASQPYAVDLDGAALQGGAGTTDAAGDMHGAFNPPALAQDENQRRSTVSVESGGQAPSATFTLTRFLAGFSPTQGDPATLRVSFSVYGFALVDPSPTVWLHYVAPNGKLKKTVRLGRAQGQCGSLEGLAKRRLFPFAHPSHGKWRLQFDTARRYRPGKAGAGGSSFLFYTVAVRVHRA